MGKKELERLEAEHEKQMTADIVCGVVFGLGIIAFFQIGNLVFGG